MDCDDEVSMHPGPRDPTVLHMQAKHRSTIVWEAGGGDTQRSRRRNPNQGIPLLHSRMVPLLTDIGFDGVARLSGIAIDWGLVTALVERWRPETHTFHLPIGECTITLQDVSVLLGLRIDGDAVVGCTGFGGGWSSLVETVFGEKPPTGRLVGGRLQLSWLASVFPSLPDNASHEQLIRYTQSYVLQLIAGVLFTDHSGGQVHCMYILLVHDLDRCKTLAWGAAVLAYLYRELCKSCKIGTEENAGCILLLQLWAWTRLHTLAPICRAPALDNVDIWGDHRGPYGLKWCAHLSFADIASHVVSTYRLALDVLAPTHFIWQPYTDELLATLPDICTEGSNFWRYKGPLICVYIVEPHQPDRCMRQFGMIQGIPSSADYSSGLHSIDLKGKHDSNWRDIHGPHILLWDSRQEHVVVADVGVDVVDGYIRWYTVMTRRYHTRIGGAQSYMLELLDHISLIARGDRHGDIDAIATQGRRVIQEQFGQGVFQDFPVEDRRAKELLIKAKPKRVGHKGGRGGINAPRRRGLVGDHLVDEDDVRPQQDPVAGDEALLQHPIQAVEEATIQTVCDAEIDPTPPLSHPDVDCFQFLQPSQTMQQPSVADVDPTPPLSHPTFNLLSSTDEEYSPSSLPSPQPTIIHPVQPERMELRSRRREGSTCGTGDQKTDKRIRR